MKRKDKEEGGKVPFLERVELMLEKKEESRRIISAETEGSLTFKVLPITHNFLLITHNLLHHHRRDRGQSYLQGITHNVFS